MIRGTMEVSKITLTPETQREIEKPLSIKKKRQLRREQVKAYIRSKPYGTRIKVSDFQKLLGYKYNGQAHTFIEKMVKDGELVKHSITPKTFFYTADEVAVVQKPKIEHHFVVAKVNSYNSKDIEELAAKFGWEHPLFNNDLREFVKWLQLKDQK